MTRACRSARESAAERKGATAAAGAATGSDGSESEGTGKAGDFLPLVVLWCGWLRPVRRTGPESSEPAEVQLRAPEEINMHDTLIQKHLKKNKIITIIIKKNHA